jgi:hypothetical protein
VTEDHRIVVARTLINLASRLIRRKHSGPWAWRCGE